MKTSRRQLMQWGAGAGLGAFATSLITRRSWAAEISSGQAPPSVSPPAARGENARPRARACVLLYMAGGPSHIDTFDPKPGAPTGGTFKAISTAVPGIQICEHLPRLGARMKELALIRSLTSKEGNHDRARHLMHTGYPPQGGVDHPAFGAMISEVREHGGMPGYVAIAGPGEDSGFLSAIHSPFPVRNPTKPVRYLTPAKNVDAQRFEERLGLWRGIEDRFAAGRGGTFARSQRAIGEQSVALMRSAGAAAFDLSGEPAKVADSYGPSEFGQGCLMARRLVEAGVPFVEVTLGGWDTHDDNFNRVKALCTTLDQAMSALLDDLRSRGLLDSTLVLWMGDFGRTPRINEKGGRDHFPACSSVLLAGGGVRGGQLIGATDQNGAEVRDRPVTVPDLYRTVAQSLDINADKQRVAPSGRPIKTVNGGKVIEGLLG
jgi:hypothetical protein